MMKICTTFALVLALFGGSLLVNIFAQSNLDKWAAKCENIEGVNVTVIHKRDKETKEEKSKMTSISFKDKPALLAELRNAASKDKKDAVEIIETKKGGELYPQIYEFYDTARKTSSKYIFSINDNGSISVVITSGNSTATISTTTTTTTTPRAPRAPRAPRIN